jgi:hypothetical protein
MLMAAVVMQRQTLIGIISAERCPHTGQLMMGCGIQRSTLQSDFEQVIDPFSKIIKAGGEGPPGLLDVLVCGRIG